MASNNNAKCLAGGELLSKLPPRCLDMREFEVRLTISNVLHEATVGLRAILKCLQKSICLLRPVSCAIWTIHKEESLARLGYECSMFVGERRDGAGWTVGSVRLREPG